MTQTRTHRVVRLFSASQAAVFNLTKESTPIETNESKPIRSHFILDILLLSIRHLEKSAENLAVVSVSGFHKCNGLAPLSACSSLNL